MWKGVFNNNDGQVRTMHLEEAQSVAADHQPGLRSEIGLQRCRRERELSLLRSAATQELPYSALTGFHPFDHVNPYQPYKAGASLTLL